jgi:SOS-response transcriptional repressor LexA
MMSSEDSIFGDSRKEVVDTISRRMRDGLSQGDRIKYSRLAAKITQTELAEKLGLKKQTLSKYENDIVENIPQKTIDAIGQILDVSPAFLMGWIDEMRHYNEGMASASVTARGSETYTTTSVSNSCAGYSSGSRATSRTTGSVSQSTTKRYPKGTVSIEELRKKKYPLVGMVACGEPLVSEDNDVFEFDAIDADFALRCRGDSMTGARIYDGDIVLIKSCPIVDNGDIAAVAVDSDGECTLKKIYYDKEHNRLTLMACNPDYPPLIIEGPALNDVRILGRAVFSISAL